MKIRIDIDPELCEEEIIIRCKEINNNVLQIQKLLIEENIKQPKLCFYKKNEDYYISSDEILFFETQVDAVYAHTVNDMYRTKSRLYEIENLLGKNFIRVSKSAVLNVKHVFSIEKSITSSSLVQFYNTHKQVYVSRHYYKNLKEQLAMQKE